jgi:quinol monooxygenase YgiN
VKHEKNSNQGDQMTTARCVIFALLSAALTVGADASIAKTTTPISSTRPQQPLTVITHLDVARVALDRALGLFDGYIKTSRAEPGNLNVEVLRQVNAPNHFTLVEVWANRAAYDAHISAAPTRDFHRQLDPLLGSPHDERLFTDEYR